MFCHSRTNLCKVNKFLFSDVRNFLNKLRFTENVKSNDLFKTKCNIISCIYHVLPWNNVSENPLLNYWNLSISIWHNACILNLSLYTTLHLQKENNMNVLSNMIFIRSLWPKMAWSDRWFWSFVSKHVIVFFLFKLFRLTVT